MHLLMEDGMVLLSLRKAVKDKGWDEIQAKLDSAEIVEITPFDANRGGLLVEYEGIRGFLPVSQLSAEHYPRVGSADKDEILQRLNALVGKNIKVRILDAIKKENKLIFSEKEQAPLREQDCFRLRFQGIRYKRRYPYLCRHIFLRQRIPPEFCHRPRKAFSQRRLLFLESFLRPLHRETLMCLYFHLLLLQNSLSCTFPLTSLRHD